MRLALADTRGKQSQGFRRRTPTAAGCDHGKDLQPIFAEGDRAPHAERQALLDVLVLTDGLLCKKIAAASSKSYSVP